MSSMADFASALGGGGGGGGMDPGGLGGGAGDPGAPPPDDTSGGGDQYTSSLDALDAAITALQSFVRLDPDPGDKAIASGCLQNLLKLQATNQTSAQSGDLKSLQRALQGTGGPPGAGAGPGAPPPPGAGAPPPPMAGY